MLPLIPAHTNTVRTQGVKAPVQWIMFAEYNQDTKEGSEA